ncbi:MAG: FTR1 family protein [Myxococcota bacterium]
MKWLRVWVVGALWVSAPARAQGSDEWHRLVGVLQYLEADYPGALASGDPFELAEQRSFVGEAAQTVRALGPQAAPFVERIDAVRSRIEAGADPEGVRAECAALVEELVAAGGLARSPRRPPDLERGRALFATACAACHGVHGDGQAELSSTMNPPPASFLDPERMSALTPYKAFNTISHGVTGTAMPGFAAVDEDERWDLAFFVFTLRQPPCDGQPPRSSLEQLSTTTDEELARAFSPQDVACLRRKTQRPDEEQALLWARGKVEEAIELAAAGKHAKAKGALLDAYLNGLEPVEPVLRARDAGQVAALEKAFLQARLLAEEGSADVPEAGRRLVVLLDQARRRGGAVGFWSVVLQALLILLREGFEATVVVAALLAVLKKMGATAQARLVHAGWMSALALGVALYFGARTILGGAQREWLEALVALAAVAMLLYAALWLNAKTNVRKLMGDLRGQMQAALGAGSAAGLFTISFTAVLRESFETVLFLQGLALDSPAGVAWGAAAGAAALVVLVLVVGRVGYRLPMKALFHISTVVLVATAVVMLGKGLRALQEVGALPLRPLSFVQIELLGVYPDAFTLLPQLLLVLAPLVWLFRTEVRRAMSAPNTAED